MQDPTALACAVAVFAGMQAHYLLITQAKLNVLKSQNCLISHRENQQRLTSQHLYL